MVRILNIDITNTKTTFVVFLLDVKNFNGSFYGIHLIFAKIMNIRNGLFCKLL